MPWVEEPAKAPQRGVSKPPKRVYVPPDIRGWDELIEAVRREDDGGNTKTRYVSTMYFSGPFEDREAAEDAMTRLFSSGYRMGVMMEEDVVRAWSRSSIRNPDDAGIQRAAARILRLVDGP